MIIVHRSIHSGHLVRQLLFERWYFSRFRTLCEFFTPANRCVVLRWDPYMHSALAVDPQQETMLPRGCTDYVAAERGRGTKGGKADRSFRMFDRAGDIRCFGNITWKGAPESYSLSSEFLRFGDNHTRERSPSKDTIWLFVEEASCSLKP